MKKVLFFLIIFISDWLVAQEKVIFPDDFNSAIIGKEVVITNTLVITNTYNVEKYGGIYLSGERLWIPTEKNSPGKEMFSNINKSNNANQLLLKKGEKSYIDENGTCRTGREIRELTGVVSYESGKYAITPTLSPGFTGNQRPLKPEPMENCNIKVASFNIENYGQSDAYLPTQRKKVVSALIALDADIYALAEVWGNNSLRDICDALNSELKTTAYKYIENIESRTLMTSFIYNNERVVPYKELMKNKNVPVSPTNKNPYLPERKIAQAFELVENGERFIICANHWKSKSGSAEGQKDELDGQGSYNPRRKEEAEATVKFINEAINYYADPDVLIVGDLNAYSKEDPIQILVNAGFINQLQKYAPDKYSYNYFTNGYSGVGYLDHSLASPSLDKQIKKAVPFPINADEPYYLKIILSNSLNPNVQQNMYKCSDHDPIVTGIFLDKETSIGKVTEQDKNKVYIYGNPKDGYLTLQAEHIERIDVLSINGQLLFTKKNEVPGSYMILPTSNLSAGVYLLRIHNGKTYTSCKFVIP